MHETEDDIRELQHRVLHTDDIAGITSIYGGDAIAEASPRSRQRC